MIALAETGNRTEAAEIAGITRWTPYSQQWKGDEVFQEALRQADEAAADLMESEAYRRAVKGWDEPAGWYKGEAGGMVRKYSDTLLIFLLKGIRAEKYKERMELRRALANLDLERLDQELRRREPSNPALKSLAAGQLDRPIRSGGALPPAPDETRPVQPNPQASALEA